MRTKHLLLTSLFCFSVLFSTFAQSQKVALYNIGKMNINTGGNNNVSIYIKGSIKHSGDKVSLVQAGTSNIAGNFFQNSTTNVFAVDANTKTTSTGTVRFVDNNTATKKRYITTHTADSLTCVNFNRGSHYIAFPNIEISTSDSIIIPARMGIDAIRIKKTNGSSADGKVVLRSASLNVGGANAAYDASLRITGSGSSESLVDAGQVIVERLVSIYREATNQPLFPFATPFKNTQLSGYFAGNWVRRPVADGNFGSTYYIYGDRDANQDGTIDANQYVKNPIDVLVPAQAYLVKPRPAGFSYGTLIATGGLALTGADASLYDKGNFVFDGKVYNLAPYSEQLFAENILTEKAISGSSAQSVNWLIGNSYTAPISTEQLRVAIAASPLKFLKKIYVYSAGSQSYQPIDLSGSTTGITVANYTEIPSMSVFMVSLPKNISQTGSFSITKDMLRHGVKSHGSPNRVLAISEFNDQINFSLTPSSNESLFDLAAIGLRSTAKLGSDNFDIAKIYATDANNFQLYTLSSEGNKLSANGVPEDVEKVTLCVRPAEGISEYKISATNVSTLSSEGAWLFDSKTNTITDLKVHPDYIFTANSVDNPNRFVVYFKNAPNPSNIGIDNIVQQGLPAIYVDNNFVLHNLDAIDINSQLSVYTSQGSLIYSGKINSNPSQKIDCYLPAGVYIIKIKGQRYTILKAIKE